MVSNGEQQTLQPQQQQNIKSINQRSNMSSIILFYKYHPLSPDWEVTELYRQALQMMCESLQLKGRILVGCSKTEGLNGTLSGKQQDVLAFTQALTCTLFTDGNTSLERQPEEVEVDVSRRRIAVETYWKSSKEFFEQINEPQLCMTMDEFKWSKTEGSSDDVPLFPDLNIKLVAELIGTGGLLSSISLEETAKGYLTPEEWHEQMTRLELTSVENRDERRNDNVILIDCRNTKEYEIGRFEGAIDPGTTTFSQFPKWVKDNSDLLADKQVFMYCTGGIRCEKASAYIRRQVPTVKDVKHLKGGIHKYLEKYGEDNDSHWMGRNFVFDGRGAASGEETRHGAATSQLEGEQKTAIEKGPLSHTVVGQCIYCNSPYDTFDPHCVCTVCREPTLVCKDCQKTLTEYHCKQHAHLKDIYFTDLGRFSQEELEDQLEGLKANIEKIAVGRRYKQKRKTLMKQYDKVWLRMKELGVGTSPIASSESPGTLASCRNCGGKDCDGRCWGFFGLKRKQVIEQKLKDDMSKNGTGDVSIATQELQRTLKRNRTEHNGRCDLRKELEELQYCAAPSTYRDSNTGIRIPPSCTRVLSCTVKAKWCGQTVARMVKEEFPGLGKSDVFQRVVDAGLLRLNDIPLSRTDASNILLKNGDVVGRIIHWHEAPVIVPESLHVQKVILPQKVLDEYNADNGEDPTIYACCKPSSVPVHPAGPYLANTLAMMVEGQEALPINSLQPIHRTDRVTSGLTLFCSSSAVARAFHRSLTERSVFKLYLAKVSGKFPDSGQEASSLVRYSDEVHNKWLDDEMKLQVDAPIFTEDVANGVRCVSNKGKAAISVFQFLGYDPMDDSSVICCNPITGRNHQLRVHLQAIGFPIIGDLLYGGRKLEGMDALSEHAVRIMKGLSSSPFLGNKVSSLSEEDVNAARKACPCCNNDADAIKSAFTNAQLLKGGHSILLHALSYKVLFLAKSTKQKRTAESQNEVIAEVEFKTNLPSWVETDVVQSKLSFKT